MTLSLRCACGSTDIVAIAPGVDPLRTGMTLFDVPLNAGSPTVVRCRACFFRRYGKVEAAGE